MKKIVTILVPTDSSAVSRIAIQYALVLAPVIIAENYALRKNAYTDYLKYNPPAYNYKELASANLIPCVRRFALSNKLT